MIIGSKMTVAFTMRVSPAPAVLAQEIEDEVVLLHTQREQYYTLNASGARMWRLLAESASIQDAYEILRAEYDAAPQQLRGDLERFVQELVEHGLVEIHPG